jgi:spore coat-associated protein N
MPLTMTSQLPWTAGLRGIRTILGHAAKTKLALTVGLIGLTVSAVGAAAFATFTSTTNVDQSTASGTVSFAAIAPNGAGNRLSLGAVNIAPGDTLQRAVTLTNTGTVDMLPGSVHLTTSATVSSLLDTDATNGLQLVIDRCSVPWTEAGTAPAYTYTCSGTTSSVLASASVIQTNTALANLTTTAAAPNYLRATLTLPGTAGNTLQNQSSTINYLFAGTQRAGTNR